jgi:hypothetical protein
LGSPLPPRRSGALGVFRRLLVVWIFRNQATTSSNLGSASEALPGTADLVLALTSQTSGRLLPWTLLPVQRSRRMESDSRLNIPGSTPSPLSVSHALRGFILYSPCHRLQMADTLRVLPFRAFFLSDPRNQLVAGAALLDVFPRSTVRSVARRCVFPRLHPRGFSLSEKRCLLATR